MSASSDQFVLGTTASGHTPDVRLTRLPGAIKIEWSRVEGATGYDIFRGQSVRGPWPIYRSVGRDVLSVIDDALPGGAQLSYRVGVHGDDVSKASVAMMIVVPPARPIVIEPPAPAVESPTSAVEPPAPVVIEPPLPSVDPPAPVVEPPTPVVETPVPVVVDPPVPIDTSDQAMLQKLITETPRGGTVVIPYRSTAYRVAELHIRTDVKYAGTAGQPRSIIVFTDRAQTQPPVNLDVTNIIFVRSPGVFISPTGSDTNPGVASAPLRTISAGVGRVAGKWETVEITAGAYRETVQFPTSQFGPAVHLPTSFVAADNASVVIDGGVLLLDGASDPALPGVFSFPWAYDFFLDGSTTERFRQSFGERGHAEQFLFDNIPLRQVFRKTDLLPSSDWTASTETVAGTLGEREIFAGRFFVDWDADVVHVRLKNDADPSTGVLEGASRKRGLITTGKSAYVLLSGLRLRNFATFPQTPNAALLPGENWTLVDVAVEHCSGASMGVRQNGVHLVRPVVRYAGQLALGTSLLGQSAVSNTIVQDGIFEHLNYKLHDGKVQGIDGTGMEYGTKFARVDGFILRACTFSDCYAPAIWFDIENRNVLVEANVLKRIVHPTSPYNGIGIFIEISPGPTVVRMNSVHQCSSAGILIGESRRVTLLGNYIDTCRHGLLLRNIAGRAYTTAEVNVGTDPLTRDLVPNHFKNWTDAAIVTDGQRAYWSTTTPATAQITIQGNTYMPAKSNRLFIWAGVVYSNFSDAATKIGVETDRPETSESN